MEYGVFMELGYRHTIKPCFYFPNEMYREIADYLKAKVMYFSEIHFDKLSYGEFPYIIRDNVIRSIQLRALELP